MSGPTLPDPGTGPDASQDAPGDLAPARPPSPSPSPSSKPDPWAAMQQFTNARIALGRTGHALPTAPWLAFNLAHAQARDAVHHPLDADALCRELHACGRPVVMVRSAVRDRAQYLRRPDLGRRLGEDSRAALRALKLPAPPELLLVIADGLSATAAGRQAVPFLDVLLPRLQGWDLGPIVVATQARVALGDDIGELLGARFVLMMIGERPGLSSPDSLGLYLTHAPRVGRRDAERNCISNVRPEGLSFEAAAAKLGYLLEQARRLGLTGVGLKDESERPGLADGAQPAASLASRPRD